MSNALMEMCNHAPVETTIATEEVDTVNTVEVQDSASLWEKPGRTQLLLVMANSSNPRLKTKTGLAANAVHDQTQEDTPPVMASSKSLNRTPLILMAATEEAHAVGVMIAKEQKEATSDPLATKTSNNRTADLPDKTTGTTEAEIVVVATLAAAVAVAAIEEETVETKAPANLKATLLSSNERSHRSQMNN